MVSMLINGLSTALCTTLIDAVLSICLILNYHLLANRDRQADHDHRRTRETPWAGLTRLKVMTATRSFAV